MATAFCKACGQWCEESDVYCSDKCEEKAMSSDCEYECEDGHLDCDSCRGTGAGMVGTDSKCGSCNGRGYTICSCVDEERQAYADDRRKADIEDRLTGDLD